MLERLTQGSFPIRLPVLSNSGCRPGKAGGSPTITLARQRNWVNRSPRQESLTVTGILADAWRDGRTFVQVTKTPMRASSPTRPRRETTGSRPPRSACGCSTGRSRRPGSRQGDVQPDSDSRVGGPGRPSTARSPRSGASPCDYGVEPARATWSYATPVGARRGRPRRGARRGPPLGRGAGGGRRRRPFAPPFAAGIGGGSRHAIVRPALYR